MLQLQPVLAELKEQGVDLYVIAAGQASGIERYFNENQLEATVVHDTDYTIFQKYAINAVPSLLLIDKEGRAAFAKLGWGADTYDNEILPLLTELLAE